MKKYLRSLFTRKPTHIRYYRANWFPGVYKKFPDGTIEYCADLGRPVLAQGCTTDKEISLKQATKMFSKPEQLKWLKSSEPLKG